LSLTGNLEDLPLLDIIQIVSFSRKTGYLSITMPGGEGGIVFEDGLVVAAFTAESPPPDPRLGGLPPERRDRAIRARIGFALEQLARLREGAFGFELTEEVPRTLGARDIAAETLAGGINPQDLLLDLASGIDAGRAESAAAVEASFAAPEEGVVGTDEDAAIVPAEALTSDLETAGPGPEEAGPPAPLATKAASPAEPEAAPPLPTSLPAAGGAPSVTPSPSPAPPPEAASEGARTILLVDDEPDVREILGRHFASAGFTIEEAGDPDNATRAAGRLRAAQTPFVVVTDLGMPASGGASFHGGFEVVKRLWKMNLRPPVVMMTENLSPSLRLRARQMGVQAFVFKPTLSKLNPRQYEADLSAFAFKLSADVLPRLAERATLAPVPHRRRSPSAPGGGAEGPPAGEETRQFEFLRRRLRDLSQPGDANEIAVLVMKVAREFFERAILFVAKGEEARGLGGFGLAPRDETLNLLARTITIPLTDPSLFRQVAEGRRSYTGLPPGDRWTTHLMARIGRFRSRGIALLPLVAHRETIALLFGDSPETGREPQGLDALEVFVHQAGIALENVFLQKKLRALQGRDAPGVG
jgi:CheY-like chemotaxis protein